MIQRDDRDGIRILRLAHGKVSAIDIELGEAFMREMQDAAAAPIKAVIVTGTASSFSAGVDLFRVVKEGAEYGRRFLPVLDGLLRAALTLPKPVVAAVNGHAIAGGCILAACCDHRIMVDGTGRIGDPRAGCRRPLPGAAAADHGRPGSGSGIAGLGLYARGPFKSMKRRRWG